MASDAPYQKFTDSIDDSPILSNSTQNTSITATNAPHKHPVHPNTPPELLPEYEHVREKTTTLWLTTRFLFLLCLSVFVFVFGLLMNQVAVNRYPGVWTSTTCTLPLDNLNTDEFIQFTADKIHDTNNIINNNLTEKTNNNTNNNNNIAIPLNDLTFDEPTQYAFYYNPCNRGFDCKLCHYNNSTLKYDYLDKQYEIDNSLIIGKDIEEDDCLGTNTRRRYNCDYIIYPKDQYGDHIPLDMSIITTNNVFKHDDHTLVVIPHYQYYIDHDIYIKQIKHSYIVMACSSIGVFFYFVCIFIQWLLPHLQKHWSFFRVFSLRHVFNLITTCIVGENILQNNAINPWEGREDVLTHVGGVDDKFKVHLDSSSSDEEDDNDIIDNDNNNNNNNNNNVNNVNNNSNANYHQDIDNNNNNNISRYDNGINDEYNNNNYSNNYSNNNIIYDDFTSIDNNNNQSNNNNYQIPDNISHSSRQFYPSQQQQYQQQIPTSYIEPLPFPSQHQQQFQQHMLNTQGSITSSYINNTNNKQKSLHVNNTGNNSPYISRPHTPGLSGKSLYQSQPQQYVQNQGFLPQSASNISFLQPSTSQQQLQSSQGNHYSINTPKK